MTASVRGAQLRGDLATFRERSRRGTYPRERQKNRHNHGRRRETTVPKLIVEIVPAEVQRLGMANFERIGHEDSSTLGHRRGGTIELVTRRGKYVPIVPSSKASALATSPAELHKNAGRGAATPRVVLGAAPAHEAESPARAERARAG